MENLKTKIENIADKYADLVEKRLTTVVQQDVVESTAMYEINDGIRMLNHVTTTLEKINRLNNGNQTNS